MNNLNVYALLIGVSNFNKDENIKEIPNIKQNIKKLKASFLDKTIFNIPKENIYVSLNEVSSDIKVKIDRVSSLARSKNDLLFIYYSGHGMLSSRNFKLYLTTTETVINHLEATSISIDEFKNLIQDSNSIYKVIILDCCYSGKIFGIQGNVESSVNANIQKLKENSSGGTFIMASADEFTPSTFDPKQPDIPTHFTQKFIEVLQEGLENNKEFCKFDEIYEEIRLDFFNKRNLPLPQKAIFSDGDKIAIVKNKRYPFEVPKWQGEFHSSTVNEDLETKIKNILIQHNIGNIELENKHLYFKKRSTFNASFSFILYSIVTLPLWFIVEPYESLIITCFFGLFFTQIVLHFLTEFYINLESGTIIERKLLFIKIEISTELKSMELVVKDYSDGTFVHIKCKSSFMSQIKIDVRTKRIDLLENIFKLILEKFNNEVIFLVNKK